MHGYGFQIYLPTALLSASSTRLRLLVILLLLPLWPRIVHEPHASRALLCHLPVRQQALVQTVCHGLLVHAEPDHDHLLLPVPELVVPARLLFDFRQELWLQLVHGCKPRLTPRQLDSRSRVLPERHGVRARRKPHHSFAPNNTAQLVFDVGSERVQSRRMERPPLTVDKRRDAQPLCLGLTNTPRAVTIVAVALVSTSYM
mmetsp:Transcript_17629/g.36142  ORF Transcript_17629/g.36142 Transcript_17629/m.36142 type:complete len:201 (+) Transcript_17629:211-813(+)